MHFDISNSLIDCCLSFTFTYVQYVVCQKGSFTCPEQVNGYKCHHAWEVKVTCRQVWWPIFWIWPIQSAHTHTHSSEHTHTLWTHTRSSGQPFMLQRPGSSWGFSALLNPYVLLGTFSSTKGCCWVLIWPQLFVCFSKWNDFWWQILF